MSQSQFGGPRLTRLSQNHHAVMTFRFDIVEDSFSGTVHTQPLALTAQFAHLASKVSHPGGSEINVCIQCCAKGVYGKLKELHPASGHCITVINFTVNARLREETTFRTLQDCLCAVGRAAEQPYLATEDQKQIPHVIASAKQSLSLCNLPLFCNCF